MKEYVRINQIAYDTLYNEYNTRAIKKSEYEEKAESLAGTVLNCAKSSFKRLTVLEIGPGSGEILSYFEENGCRTVAVELSTKMAEMAKIRSSLTVFIINDITETKFCNDQFEVIYAGALIHLFPLNDALELMKKFYNWLKPNGILFVNTTIHDVSEEGYYKKEDYGISVKRFRKKWTEKEFILAIQNTGLEIIQRLFTNEQDRKKQWVAFLCRKP